MSEHLLFAVVPNDGVDAAWLGGGKGCPPGLQIIATGGLAAVVGPAPAGGLQGRDRSTLLPWLLARQAVMERLLERGAVLPIALGIIADDEAQVRHLLTAGARPLGGALETLSERCEMNISVRMPLTAMLSPLLADISIPSSADASAGGVAEREHLDALLTTRVNQERERITRAVVERLADGGRELIVSQPADSESVVEIALLMSRDGEAALDRDLERLDAAFAGQLTLRVVGPLAPYSFATVHVNLPSATAVAAARRLLELEGGEDAGMLKRAYHHAVRRVHPDLVGDGGEAVPGEGDEASGVHELTAAYHLLLADLVPVSVRRLDRRPFA